MQSVRTRSERAVGAGKLRVFREEGNPQEACSFRYSVCSKHESSCSKAPRVRPPDSNWSGVHHGHDAKELSAPNRVSRSHEAVQADTSERMCDVLFTKHARSRSSDPAVVWCPSKGANPSRDDEVSEASLTHPTRPKPWAGRASAMTEAGLHAVKRVLSIPTSVKRGRVEIGTKEECL